MDVTPLIRRDTKIIQSYRDGQFRVSGDIFTGPILVTATRVLQWPQGEADVTAESFAALADIDDAIEMILFGTGSRMAQLPAAIRREIKEKFGFSIDTMDTGAACRTYNVLMAEGRKVAAALTPFK